MTTVKFKYMGLEVEADIGVIDGHILYCDALSVFLNGEDFVDKLSEEFLLDIEDEAVDYYLLFAEGATCE